MDPLSITTDNENNRHNKRYRPKTHEEEPHSKTGMVIANYWPRLLVNKHLDNIRPLIKLSPFLILECINGLCTCLWCRLSLFRLNNMLRVSCVYVLYGWEVSVNGAFPFVFPSLILAEMSKSVKRFLSDLIQTYVDVKQFGRYSSRPCSYRDGSLSLDVGDTKLVPLW